MSRAGGLVVLVIGFALLAPPAQRAAGRTLTDAATALADWYDTQDGIGRPCDDSARVMYHGPGDFNLAIPSCWTTAVAHAAGIEVHQLRDPAAGLGDVAVTALRPADGALWRQTRAALATRLATADGTVERSGQFRLAKLTYTDGDPRVPWRYYEWHVSDDLGSLTVSYRVAKLHAASPRIARIIHAVDDAARSARRSPFQGRRPEGEIR